MNFPHWIPLSILFGRINSEEIVSIQMFSSWFSQIAQIYFHADFADYADFILSQISQIAQIRNE